MIILITISMFAIIGVAALAIDGSFMYEKRNRLHAAADAAAKSAAIEAQRGNASNRWAFAQREVEAHGFSDSVIQAVNWPYTSALCPSSCVEVILREQTSTFFGRVLGFTDMTPRARSVAGTASSNGCLLTLNPTGPGLVMANNTSIQAPACDVLINSDASNALDMGANTLIDARGTGVVGDADMKNHAVVQPSLTTVIAHFSDPVAGVYGVPTAAGSCATVPPPVSGKITVVSAGTASTGIVTKLCAISLNNNVEIEFPSGNYLIDGGIELKNNNTITAPAGVMLYIINGKIDIQNSATINITAPTSGPWAGLAVWQAGNNSISLKNGGEWNVNGITYAPLEGFHADNGDDIKGNCSIFVVAKMDIGNNTAQLSNTCTTFGGNPLKTLALAE